MDFFFFFLQLQLAPAPAVRDVSHCVGRYVQVVYLVRMSSRRNASARGGGGGACFLANPKDRRSRGGKRGKEAGGRRRGWRGELRVLFCFAAPRITITAPQVRPDHAAHIDSGGMLKELWNRQTKTNRDEDKLTRQRA